MSKDKHKIILVEDSSELGYLLSEYLSMKNFEISWFINGTSALCQTWMVFHLQNR